MTYFTPLSTNFCATATPALGSHWSSSDCSSNFRVLPATCSFLALSSSMARRTPFSLSLPAKALGPESGPVWPILTTCSCARALPASARVRAANSAECLNELCIIFSFWDGLFREWWISGHRPVFLRTACQRLLDDGNDRFALGSYQRQAGSTHVLGADAGHHVDQLQVLHKLGGRCQHRTHA